MADGPAAIGRDGPLHVLVVARWYPAYDGRGAGIFVADHCAALAARGVEVTVGSWDHLARFSGDAATAARLGRRWIDAAAARPPIATPRAWGAPDTPVARLRAVAGPRREAAADLLDQARAQTDPLVAFGRALHRRRPIDVIHAHTGLPDGLAALALAKDLGVPLVTIEHDSKVAGRMADAEVRRRYAELLGDGRALVAVSATLRGRLASALGVEPSRIDVIPNPVAVDAFPLADPAGRDPDELLFVGRLRADKGIATLIEAVGIVRRARPDRPPRLRLQGQHGPEDAEAWHRLAARNGLAESLRLETPADRSVVSDAMQHAGLFVHPSPFETFGIVAAEALATGLLVAATPSGGVEEIVGTDGRLGEIAAGPTAPALAAAIGRALDRRSSLDPGTLRQSIVERFGAAEVADRFLAIDTRLLETASHTTTEPAPATASAARPDGPTAFEPPLIVAFRRRAIDLRFAALAPELQARLPVLTTPSAATGSSTDPSPTSTGGWTVVDDDRAIREALDGLGRPPVADASARAAWLVRHPVAAVRRRWIARDRTRVRLAERREALAVWMAGHRGGGARGLVLLPLDADDLVAVEPFLGEGVELAAGGLRWLADAWDEAVARGTARRPGTVSEESDAPG